MLRWPSLWGPVLCWAGVIFYLSSIPDYRTAGQSELPELMFRKFAHLFEYGLLAFLLARALSGFGWEPRRVLVLGLFLCVLYAVSDEWHQSFIPGRFGKARDVVLDSLGAALVLSLYARQRNSSLFQTTKHPAVQ